VRRLLELASRGLLRKRIVRDGKNGNRALTLFNGQDIDALATQSEAPALLLSGPVRPLALPMPGEPKASFESPRLWLTLAEAADYSGLPATFLIQLVAEKRLPAFDVGVRPGGRWRIARRDLDGISV